MRLATLKAGGRDGTLVVVRRDGAAYATAREIAPHLQAALDDWERCEPLLRALAAQLDAGQVSATPLDPHALHSPLPRAYEWVDGSAFLNHVILVRKARGAEPPATLKTDPLVYQGGSGVLLAPTDDIPLADPRWGLDFEAEVACILGDTPQATRDPAQHVKLLCLVNDVTLRSLVPDELAKGFGFFTSKPPRSRRSPSRPTSWGPPGRTAACTCACVPPTTARWWATPTPARRCTSPSSICSGTSPRRAASPPGRSWARAPSPTPTGRAASPASPSGA
jgi:2-keto-4-pentenoate hydratase/2-oxohepta-3-ene-1,7-dioic acid hydratase in catechol pathway